VKRSLQLRRNHELTIMRMTQRIAVRVALAALVALPLSGCSYNRFVGQQEAIKAQWAQVENQLKRRNDLIPNLVATVKGYAAHEEGVFKEVSDANARMAALGRLIAIAQNYPQLKADEQFNRLMDELAGTENRIAVERMRYNERVQEYDTARRQFPSNVTAKLFGFQEYPYFQVPAGEQQVPKVDFSKPQ
jgi:LemA protein